MFLVKIKKFQLKNKWKIIGMEDAWKPERFLDSLFSGIGGAPPASWGFLSLRCGIIVINRHGDFCYQEVVL